MIHKKDHFMLYCWNFHLATGQSSNMSFCMKLTNL